MDETRLSCVIVFYSNANESVIANERILLAVMAGPVPAIHDLISKATSLYQDVDGLAKPGHDGMRISFYHHPEERRKARLEGRCK